jgi:SsrA-binding protein
MTTKKEREKKVVTTNRKAYHDYEVLETHEAGIVLKGYEVKSLREGKASLVDGVVLFSKHEAFLENVYIPPYLQQSTHVFDYNPTQKRKLLLHKTEIDRLYTRTREKGFTVIPLEIFFSPRNIAKVVIGLCKGKHAFDKRETLRKRDIDRDTQREMRTR